MITNNLNRLRFLLAIPLLLALLLVSCKQEKQPAEAQVEPQKAKVPTEPAALPDSITQAIATKHIDLFKDAQMGSLDDDFFFGGNTDNAAKVISFRLDQEQGPAFFARLDAAQNTAKEVLLRIHPALSTEDQSEAIFNRPNIELLVELVVDSVPQQIYYPLRAFNSPFLADFEQLYAWQDTSTAICPIELDCGHEGVINQAKVGAKCARELVSNWDAVPLKEIAQQLYVEQDTVSPTKRLQYYTFSAADTKLVHQYQKQLVQDGKSCFFYLHFGQLAGEIDCVPLRTIIHLDDNPIDVGLLPERTNDEHAYFEFALPCPKFCKD